MTHTFLKMTAITSIAMIASAGTALAGDDKNCHDKKETKQTSAMRTNAVANQTVVLGASAKTKTAKKQRVLLNFEDAMKLCQDKGAYDLQACIDYKTGVTQTYKKSAS